MNDPEVMERIMFALERIADHIETIRMLKEAEEWNVFIVENLSTPVVAENGWMKNEIANGKLLLYLWTDQGMFLFLEIIVPPVKSWFNFMEHLIWLHLGFAVA